MFDSSYKLLFSFFVNGLFIQQAVVDIVKTLPVSLVANLMEWISKYSKNAKVPLANLSRHFCFSVVEFGESLFFQRK